MQVVNNTMLRLNVGERTSLNRDVKIIHTLAAHESFCLSALRDEPGLICFQPAGECLLCTLCSYPMGHLYWDCWHGFITAAYTNT